MRCASALRCPWLVIGSVPPADSITMSAQKTPVEMCTEATCLMPMLSSLLPNRRGLIRLTCWAFTIMRVGKNRLPFVQRLALKDSPSGIVVVINGIDCPVAIAVLKRYLEVGSEAQFTNYKSVLHPLERALLPYPDVAYDQDAQKYQHLDESENAQRLELDRPWKQEDCFHIEHDKQDGNNVVAHRIASAGVVIGIDPTRVGDQLGAIGTLRANDARDHQREPNQDSDDGDEEKSRNVILRHEASYEWLPGRTRIVPLNGAAFKARKALVVSQFASKLRHYRSSGSETSRNGSCFSGTGDPS